LNKILLFSFVSFSQTEKWEKKSAVFMTKNKLENLDNPQRAVDMITEYFGMELNGRNYRKKVVEINAKRKTAIWICVKELFHHIAVNVV
jgi:hypothetical protein